MIRRIGLGSLRPGMYVVDVHCGWLQHGLWRTRFRVPDEDFIRRLAGDGITEVSIDTGRGLDISPEAEAGPPPPAPEPVPRESRRPLPAVSLGEERRRAGRLLRDAEAALQALVDAARGGRIGDPGRLEPLVARMLDSVRRHPDGLAPLARVRRHHSYAASHAVASAALMIVLGFHRGLAEAEIEHLALGALLKDLGQASLEAGLANREGSLSLAERALVRRHVEAGMAALESAGRLAAGTAAVVLQHHERFDGGGYPARLAGEAISAAGRMAAVVDSYDAMTSVRPYRAALSPVAALRQLFRDGGRHFDPALVASFIHALGIYPVGSLVRLESGHLAIVEAQHRGQLLKPVVRVVYNTASRRCVTPVEVDLARRFGNPFGQIVSAEEGTAWEINPDSWQPA